MKLSRILILLFLTTNALIQNTDCTAQNIGINSSGAVPNSSSLLDIDAAPGNNKGLLIPRMALVSSTDATTIANPATSLLVYHTGSGGLPVVGYYYNSGTSGSPVWVQLLNGGSPGTAWMLTGNTGTTGGPNFLGTKDNISLRFRTNNTQRFIIDSLGNVGIGTASPGYKLHVAGSMRWGGTGSTAPYVYSDEDALGLYLEQVGTTTANSRIRLQSSPSGSLSSYSQFFVDPANGFSFMSSAGGNSGNVGIGTTSPGAKLDVAASTNALLTDLTQSISNSGILITADITNTFHNSGIFWRSLNNNPTKPKAGIWMYNENGPGSWLLFGTSNSYATGITNTALAIAPSGNVGIGTTSPTVPLQVHSTNSATYFHVTNATSGAASSDGLELSANNDFGSNVWNYENGYLRFATNNSERVRIDPAGNVGIGTTTPLSKLQINGDLATQNGQVKRDFLTWNTSAGTNVIIHIKTNITCANIMYRFLIEGYNYGMASAINSEAVGYAYAGTGTIISNQNIDHSPGVISSQYLSSDGFVVIRLNPNGSNYYIGFSVSGWFVNPTGNAFNISGVVYHQNANL